MRKQRKQLYEGMYILSATLSDDLRQKALQKILDQITSQEGEVHKVHDMGRKKLAYTIRRKKEGYYYLVYFTVGTQVISDLWKEYHLNEDLLRFMTMQADEVQEELVFKTLKT